MVKGSRIGDFGQAPSANAGSFRHQAKRALLSGREGGPVRAAGLLEWWVAVPAAMSRVALTMLLYVVDGVERDRPRAQTARPPARWGVRAPLHTHRAAPPSPVESRRAGARSALGWPVSWWVLTTSRAEGAASRSLLWQPKTRGGKEGRKERLRRHGIVARSISLSSRATARLTRRSASPRPSPAGSGAGSTRPVHAPTAAARAYAPARRARTPRCSAWP